jgi:hypothetical protein
MPGVSGVFGAIWVTDWAMPEICPGGWSKLGRALFTKYKDFNGRDSVLYLWR